MLPLWLRLATLGFLLNCKPSEPYLNLYLTTTKNLTETQLANEVYPYSTFGAAAFLLPLGLFAESFGSRAGTLLSDESEQLLGDELGLLLNESDALQRELVSSMHHQRLLTSLSEKERNASGSWLQPLATVTRLAAEEAEGHRRALGRKAETTPHL